VEFAVKALVLSVCACAVLAVIGVCLLLCGAGTTKDGGLWQLRLA